MIDLSSGLPTSIEGVGGLPLGRFRKSSREQGVFIEKNRFRISTAGEKREITQKGIAASSFGRSKKKKKGPFEWGIFGGI